MSPSPPIAPSSPNEHWFQSQLVGVMTPGEVIFGATYLQPYVPNQTLLAHAADGLEGIRRRAAYVVVTDRRVLLVQTPIGAFHTPVFQNVGIRAIDRGDVVGVSVGRWAIFELTDGTFLEYLVGPSAKYFPNQPQFVAALSGWLGPSPRAVHRIRALEAEKRRRLVWLVALAAMCVLYAIYVKVLRH